MNTKELPYIELDEFAKTNFVLTSLFGNPKSKIKTWEGLPDHLKQDLFNKLCCKPMIFKY